MKILSHYLDYLDDFMKDLTVEELLLIISEYINDPEKANKAFSELYWRFSERLTRSVRGILKSKGIYSPDLVEYAVSNTFMEVFKKPLGFNYDSEKHSSEVSAFKGYLYVIARNEIMDLMKKSIHNSDLHAIGIEDEVIENMAEIDVEMEVLSGNRLLLEKALSVLSDREKAILLAHFDCYEEGKNTPSETLNIICEYWGTTRDNARQIKHRSLKKVKQRLEELGLKSEAK